MRKVSDSVKTLLSLLVVFMGSRKYENVNDFDAYVTEHGGSSNAFTDCEQVTALYVCYIPSV